MWESFHISPEPISRILQSIMLALVSLPTSFAGSAVSTNVRATIRMETEADLMVLAKKLNPSLGYYNPTPLAQMEFWGKSQESSIGFLRQAEINHGRVAMAAFVGFVVQSNFHWPWAMTLSGTTYADIAAAGGPASREVHEGRTQPAAEVLGCRSMALSLSLSAALF
jgi:hypothetical protein